MSATPKAVAHSKVDAPSLKERFAYPPARYRILPMKHGLPVAPAEQDALMDQLGARGFGGMVVNVGSENYLRDEGQWKAFTRGVTEAKKRGMAMWLYDERGYPSGNAGGLTMQGHPEWEARGLKVADTACQGGPVELTLPPGELRQALAFPLAGGAIDLDKAVDLAKNVKDGKLAWKAPKGEWRVMAITEDALYDGTHAQASYGDKLPYVNLLRPEPTKRFLEVTHQAYADHLDNKLGNYFLGTFTDEPSLMGMLMRKQPYRQLPWSRGFAAEFKKRRGYAIEPLVPALAAEAGPRGARARYDYWLTVADLVSENYFGQIRTWCRKHNIPSGGHLLIEEGLLIHVPNYGDLFRCEKMLDAPSLDCLNSNPPDVHWYSARLISSAGELIGRYDNQCETSDHVQCYRPQGDTRPVIDVTEAQIRGTCNRLIVSGINGITSYYRFAGLSDDQLRRLNQYVARCCAMLHGGRQVTDVAVLYPIQSVWPRFEPSHFFTEGAPKPAQQVERIFRDVSDQLFFNQRDFTFIDAATLEDGKVDKGVFTYNGLAWRVIVLPCADTLPLKAWENLAKFWRSGGVIVAVGALPTNSEREFPSPAVQAIAKEIFPQGAGARRAVANAGGLKGVSLSAFSSPAVQAAVGAVPTEGPGASVYLPRADAERLPAVLDALIEPAVKVAQAGSPLRVTHRRIEGQEVFFLINDSDQPWAGAVSLAAAGKGEYYDPASGGVTPLSGSKNLALKLDAYGGALFRFDAPQIPARHAEAGKALRAALGE
jgi:hypothetical protein